MHSTVPLHNRPILPKNAELRFKQVRLGQLSEPVQCLTRFPFSRDRFRTMINVLGDALAAGIIAHLCRKDFPTSDETVVLQPCTFQTPSDLTEYAL